MNDEIAKLFLEHSVAKLGQMTESMASCVGRLSEAQVWERHGAHENAVGNLILHLEGNMRQWILFGIDRQPDVRVRDAEFAVSGGLSGDELMKIFRTTVEESKSVIASLPAERLVERITPQHGELSVLDAIYQVVGHVQMHVGQIIVLTKRMTGKDLDLVMPRKR